MSESGEIKKVKIRAFRAAEDVESCNRYIDGHKKILEIYGVPKVTSSTTQWKDDPNSYVILVESVESEKIYGGARIQVVSPSLPLPIEDAVGELDPYVYSLVNDLNKKRTGELCGLWNSREVAGLGIGSVFLGRAGVSIVTQIGLGSLFALCAPATVQNCLRTGFLVEERLGDKGTFYYPKLDLIATAVLLKDPVELSTADANEREKIMALRQNPKMSILENGRRGVIEIDFDLEVPHYQLY